MPSFGWKRDLPDHRDIYYEPGLTGVLPKIADLRTHCPPVYDQGKLGSCTANAIAGHLDFLRHKQGEPLIFPSRLFIYYNERLMEGTVESDAGASIRDSVKEVVKYGACPERQWPYEIDLFAVEPQEFCYEQAIKYEALQYLRLKQDEYAFKHCLADGYPFVVGISVYDSFMSASNGQIPMPDTSEQLLGGHAVMVVGYEADKWIVRNSWGKSWGDHGYFYLPKAYLLSPDLSDDSWTLRKVK